MDATTIRAALMESLSPTAWNLVGEVFDKLQIDAKRSEDCAQVRRLLKWLLQDDEFKAALEGQLRSPTQEAWEPGARTKTVEKSK